MAAGSSFRAELRELTAPDVEWTGSFVARTARSMSSSGPRLRR